MVGYIWQSVLYIILHNNEPENLCESENYKLWGIIASGNAQKKISIKSKSNCWRGIIEIICGLF
jgi:hypothetical protein